MRQSFNFASIGVSIRKLAEKVEVLVVNYFNDENRIEIRFPAGTVQLMDICKALEWFIEKNNLALTMHPLLWLTSEVMDFSKEFDVQVNSCSSRHQKNLLLESYLSKILDKLLALDLSEEEVDSILYKCRIITLEREAEQETDAFEFGKWVQASTSLLGTHEKCCYVSLETKAPDFYQGSADEDIESSYWIPIENVESKISKKHLNYFYSSIKKAVEELNLGEEFMIYCPATNH